MCKGHDATPINLIYSMIKMKRKISGTSLFCTLGVLIKDKWVRIELQNFKKKWGISKSIQSDFVHFIFWFLL